MTDGRSSLTSLQLSQPGGTAPAAPRQPPPRRRRAMRDKPAVLLLGILLLGAALAGTMTLANRSASLAPDFLSEFVLYALSVVDLTMLLALVFVLARSVVKLVVERRRGLPFARFRAKLVTLLLAMTLVPAVLVLLVGSELIRTSVENWFNAPMDEVLDSARRIASDYYHERQGQVTAEAARLAKALSDLDLAAPDIRPARDIVTPEVTQQRAGLVEVYRVVRQGTALPQVVPVVDVASSSMPSAVSRAAADRIATRAAAGQPDTWVREPLDGGGEIIRAAAAVRKADGLVVGVVVASDHLTGDLAARSRRMTNAYESYTQLRVLKRPLTGVYLSFFLMVTLMILVGATWMGLYLAKRITRPVLLLAAAAREIGAGHFDHRVERETADEFGSLVDAFNSMADELAASRRKLERFTVDLQRKHVEVEERRRYTEAILERIATGVVSIDASGRVTTVNAAATRLLGLDPGVIGQPAAKVFSRPDLEALAALALGASSVTADPPAQEIALARDGR
jgi:two-component system nitrogen regulation sensor histidine kinase NtrY